MNCEWIKTNGTLYLYNELPDDALHELEQHLRQCPKCAEEMESLRRFYALLAAAPVVEPSPSLLAAARMKLQEALETAEPARGWSRWALDLTGWAHQLRLAPALSLALLMVGFAGGILTTFGTMTNRAPSDSVASSGMQPLDSASIAAIRDITQDPRSNRVQITYDKLVPDSAQGSIDDPRIQRLLLYAARSNYNSGVRMDSIDVLTQKSEDERIREALIYALRYDKNPGVRLKALEGLRSYVKSDMRVRDAVLEALVRDSNAGVRTEAIRLLQSVTADTSVRETLRALAAQDENDYIRGESRRVLASLPEIE